MPQKYCRKFEPPEQGARTLQTTDRRQTDGRQHIANVNVSSRSLKIVQRINIVKNCDFSSKKIVSNSRNNMVSGIYIETGNQRQVSILRCRHQFSSDKDGSVGLHRYYCMAELPSGQLGLCRYLIYSEIKFSVFRPAGTTFCTDQSGNWRGRPDRSQISPYSVHRWDMGPHKETVNFTNFWNNNNVRFLPNFLDLWTFRGAFAFLSCRFCSEDAEVLGFYLGRCISPQISSASRGETVIPKTKGVERMLRSCRIPRQYDTARTGDVAGRRRMLLCLFMVALCNRETIYVFIL